MDYDAASPSPSPPVEPVSSDQPWLNGLNPAQLDAVQQLEGPLLVLSGAGTGKTRVLTCRLVNLLASGVARPWNILAVTFTNKAAREMKERVAAMIGPAAEQVWFGTFHSLAARILRRHAECVGLKPNFTILDTDDQLRLIKQLMEVAGLDPKRFPPRAILASISRWKDKALTPDKVSPSEEMELAEGSGADIYRQYQDRLRELNACDFGDLLLHNLTIFNAHPDILAEYHGRITHLMVDEYQDTNKIQASLCEYFSSFHQNLTVVGDDAQSIYAFRGSDYENILRFPEEHANTELIKLEENYRSSPEILEVANAVLKQSSILFKKKLFTNRESSDLPALIKTIDDKEEAEFISQLVLHLREHQIALGEVAVLFRNARDSFTLELALQSKDIPFKKFGGQKFTEAAHIKDVLAHIRILSNPNDTVAWQRVLMLIEGVGPKTAEDLFLWIQEVQRKKRGASSKDSTHWFSDSEWMNKNYFNGLNRLGLCLMNASKCTPWHDSVPLIVDYYLPICKDLYDGASKREEDLASLLQITKTYQDIQSFLTDLVLEPITDTVTDTLASREEEAPLTLSTIHSAKGLEWKHVLIMQCLDGSIPSTFSIDNEESLDEELRLLYVATTRAKEMLYFTYPRTSFRQREGDYLTKASRFLDPITANLEPWELIHDTHDPNLNEGNKPPLLE